MAQPKNRQHRRGEEDKKNPHRQELENLSKKADGVVQKRNELNSQANEHRAQRDLLNGRKKELFDAMNQAKAERDKLNAQMRQHREARNQFQAQAKELIAKKRGRLKKEAPSVKSPGLRAQELLAEIRDLEFAQETQVLTTAKENELVKQIRLRRHEYGQIKKEAAKAAKLDIDLSDTDKAIDQLFARAEAEHQAMVQAVKAAQAAHERFLKVFNDASILIAEADAKHRLFLETRTKADEQHQQFLELRDKMLDLRGKDLADRRESREIIREQQKRVRQAVADPKKLDEVAEQTLQQLKKSGKIRLGS